MIFNWDKVKIFVYDAPIDFCCGIERLNAFIKLKFEEVFLVNHVFLFFGKNKKRIKALYHDGSGLASVNKRLERGQFMKLEDILNLGVITTDDLKSIIHGGRVVRVKEDNIPAKTFEKKYKFVKKTIEFERRID